MTSGLPATGMALDMKLKLKRLAVRHGVTTEPQLVALSPPADGPMILEGVAASSTSINLSRTKFRAFAFNNPCLLTQAELPPLYFKHDEKQIAGQIESLRYDDKGQVLITARVDHELARRCNAFSVAARVNKYSLHNEASPDYFALIEQAEITEISLTDCPADGAALVQHRYPAPVVGESYHLLAEGFRSLIKLTGPIAEALVAAHRRQAEPAPARPRRLTHMSKTVTSTKPRAKTQFQNLVQAMEANHA